MTYKVPTAAEKQILFKAGLGLKKIKFDIDDDEEAVMKKITSAESDSNELTGFPKLRDCGGFELIRCVANCRELVLIEGSWGVRELKANVGAQAKIYLRPIQKNLSTEPLAAEKTSKVKEICLSCNKEFFVHELRRHSFVCADMFDTSEESDEKKQHEPAPTDITMLSDTSVSTFSTPSIETSTVATDNLITTDVTSGNSALAPITIDPDESLPDMQVQENTVDDIVVELVKYCSANDISNTAEILSCFQSMFVQGRALEIKDPSVCEEGDPNVIFIDRGNVLDSGFDEVDQIQNLRTTFIDVESYGEVQ